MSQWRESYNEGGHRVTYLHHRAKAAAAARLEKEKKSGLVNLMEALFTPIFIKAFTMTFVAEWGDRSQIATIALASSKDPYGVTLGGTIGHGLCTGLAVVGGKLLAAKISERTVALSGGVLFLIFAVHEMWVGP